MIDKITLVRCRELINNNQKYSDKEIEQIRDTLYAFGALVVKRVKAIKDAFTKRFQSISCKGFIVK